MLLLARATRSRTVLNRQAVQPGSGLGCHKMKFRSSNQTCAWHAHTEQPLQQFSQHSQPLQGTAAPPAYQTSAIFIQNTQLRTLSADKMSTEALWVFIIYLIVGHQKEYYTFF